MEFTEKTVKENVVYDGKILRVRVDEVELHNGRITKREVCDHRGGVAVLPVTDAGDVILVTQFRYPYMKTVLEIPAGKLEDGEEPLLCGMRELREETGYEAGEITSLGHLYPSPGYTNEKIYLFMARALSAGDASPDEGEFVSVRKIPMEQALSMVEKDEIHDAKTVAAILKAARILGR